MPVYVYECNKCGHTFEVMQKVDEEPRKRCPECKGKVKKVFQPVGIVFKGGGFYKTDSRKKCTADSCGTKECAAAKTCESPACAAKAD
ncbi:MAG TPA: zinc ribbon domain-containing protein [bacterium]|nr:zinc ribbon domain-containing protein [bacterium]